MEQKTIVLCIAAAAVLLVLISLAWSRLSAWLAARELRHAYQARPLFSAHERAAYRTLKAMTDELGLVLFVKVRLLDLAEPRPHHRKYQLYLNKVSAKHVDFVAPKASPGWSSSWTTSRMIRPRGRRATSSWIRCWKAAATGSCIRGMLTGTSCIRCSGVCGAHGQQENRKE